MGWQEKLKGYQLKILLVPESERGVRLGWNGYSKDLEGVSPGFGKTEEEALAATKNNIREKIRKVTAPRPHHPPEKPSFTCVTGVLLPGSKTVMVLVRMDE